MVDLQNIYSLLLKSQGHQKWWPGESAFEVMVGAILTQNTAWANVEKAISNLKGSNLLSFEGLENVGAEKLAELIRPAGYYNQKTMKLKRLISYLRENYEGEVESMASRSLSSLREELLSVNGIGPETADSILLYALEKPIFVVDAYTARLAMRLGLFFEAPDYHQLQEYFMDHLPKDVPLFNDFHAQIVRHGKDRCKKTNPKCPECPLFDLCKVPLEIDLNRSSSAR